MSYDIQFTQGSETMATWTGYATRAEAVREIREADMMIPMTWDYTILNNAMSVDDYLSIEESLIDYEDE